jgi:hypothetical protein
MNTSTWQTSVPVATKMSITERRASTVFDRANFTILDVMNLSDPVPVNYEPEDFFAFYKFIFAVNLTSRDFAKSTQYSFLLTIASYLHDRNDLRIQDFGGSKRIRLQEFLATPIIIYNDAWLGVTTTTPGMGKTITLAIPSYRVLVI